MDPLVIALPKGRMQDEVLVLFKAAGYEISDKELASRRLIISDTTGSLRFILAKPTDVPTFVEYGAADLGVVGEDVLRESGRDVYEPLALGLARCRLVLAGPPEARDRNLNLEPNIRIATKYPSLALDYFARRGITVEIIPMNGSIELAPAVGLADLLVDLVQTGRTLRENGLIVLEEVMDSEAMLIVNRASHKLRFVAIREIISKLEAQLQPLDSEESAS